MSERKRRARLPDWDLASRRSLGDAYIARVDRTLELLKDIAAALGPAGRRAAAPRKPKGTIKLKERR